MNPFQAVALNWFGEKKLACCYGTKFVTNSSSAICDAQTSVTKTNPATLRRKMFRHNVLVSQFATETIDPSQSPSKCGDGILAMHFFVANTI